MNQTKYIKDSLSQILALTEIRIKLLLRFKFKIIIDFITPIVAILMPMIIMGQFFTYNVKFGPWNETNYIIFILLSYNFTLLQQLINRFPTAFSQEKYWFTLQGLLIAPFNRVNLLFGIFLSHIVVISIPFSVMLILGLFYYNISIVSFIFIIFLFFLIALIFSGIGLFIGIFVISNENIYYFLNFSMMFIFWFSCISYPFELFPGIIQNIIELNPLYYIFDIVRFAWLENNILYTIINHSFNLIVILACSIIIPGLGVFFFNKVYKKYGIVGY